MAVQEWEGRCCLRATEKEEPLNAPPHNVEFVSGRDGGGVTDVRCLRKWNNIPNGRERGLVATGGWVGMLR